MGFVRVRGRVRVFVTSARRVFCSFVFAYCTPLLELSPFLPLPAGGFDCFDLFAMPEDMRNVCVVFVRSRRPLRGGNNTSEMHSRWCVHDASWPIPYRDVSFRVYVLQSLHMYPERPVRPQIRAKTEVQSEILRNARALILHELVNDFGSNW